MSTSRPHDPVAGAVEPVRDGLNSVVLPFHSHYPGATLTYVIEAGDGSLCVVDPAQHTDENLRLLDGAVTGIGRRLADIALVVVTHLHPDHIGMADAVRRISGAVVALHAADQAALDDGLPATRVGGDWFARWGAPPERWPELVRWWVEERRYRVVTADLLLQDGERLPVPGRELTVLHTPGHTTGSVCLVDAADEVVLTGDHLLPDVYPGIGLGGGSAGNPIGDYLASLDRLRPFDGFEALPGHGRRFRPLGERRARIDAHHRRRSAEVDAALDALDRPTVWEVAARLRWSGGWAAMRDYRLASALAQTEWHADLLGRKGDLLMPVGGAAEE
jgi:glyoxylase-like metal-dependent hydrolase (beta-lactamase superfamily II)